ncbi:MAG: hypothetical protein R3B72_19025 [Polyangiaceae bacterium]
MMPKTVPLLLSLFVAPLGCQLVAGQGDFTFDATSMGSGGAPSSSSSPASGGGSPATCDNGVLDDDETSIDCGGPCGGCAELGEACDDDATCASGHCAAVPGGGGVCCNTACQGTCVACLGSQTGGDDGSCEAVLAGTDPAGECIADIDGCGAQGTGCNGDPIAPACNLQPVGKACSDATCIGESYTEAGSCNGAGTCLAGATTSCGLYTCADDGGACQTTCADSSDCAPGAFCDGNQCAPLKTLGSACESGEECASGFCPGDDGICCDAACGGQCVACLSAKTGGPSGQCLPVSNNQDPDDECPALQTCNGSGSCSL